MGFSFPRQTPLCMQDSLHKQNSFDFIRVVAALCVVCSHQFALNGLREPSVLNVHSLGGFGVLLFFSISGFLVMQSWEADPNVFRFGVKRFLRIWPGFAVVITLTALVLGPCISTLSLQDYYAHPLVKDYFNNLQFSLRDQLPLTFVGSALPTAINGPIWTIPLEVKCYLALAVLGLAGLLRGKGLVTTLLTAALVFVYAVLEPRGDRIVNGLQWVPEQRYLLEFGLFFFAGVIICKYKVTETRNRGITVLALCWLAAGIAFVCDRAFLALWLVVPVTTLLIGTASTPYLRRAGRFGDISYGLYVYAFPVQQTLIWLYKDRMSWGMLFLLVLVVTTGLAFASWHGIEKRALRLKPRRPSARKEQAVPLGGTPRVGESA